VRTRGLSLFALGALALGALGAGGCGGVGASSASEATGGQLAIYSSLPLQGPSAAVSRQIVNGERLALSQAGGRVGDLKVAYVSLDDVNPTSGVIDPGVTATNAKMAAQDASTIAYIGDYNSSATAVSLPLINAAGILQVSPASPYVGLTSALDAGQDEPARFYPSGKRTFARIAPGDPVQAQAQVRLMRSLGVHRLYALDDQDPFEIPLAAIVSGDAEHAGIAVAAHDSISTAPGAVFTGEIEKIVRSGAQAVFFAGGTGPGALRLWRELHAADPQLLLLGSSAMLNASFAAALGRDAASTYITTPALPLSDYPPAAIRVARLYRQHFGVLPEAYALYGYEAMSAVLDAIRRAGARGNNRVTVIERFLATRHRDSVLGRYSIQPNGESTLSQYGVMRIVAGRLVFDRALATG
jgi:branched-chain amino acid transport system substrate-binding protein